MRNQPATKSWKNLDAPGQVVFILAGMMVVTWFFGTCLYFMIPQSGKKEAVAAKSKSAGTENRQVASLEPDSQSNLNETENETSSSPETSGRDNSETDSPAESNPKSNMLALDERETTPPIEEALEPEPKPEPKPEPRSFSENKPELKPETETVPIPQPKLNLGGDSDNSNLNPLEGPSITEPPIEEPEPAIEVPTFEPEPMLSEPVSPTEPEERPVAPQPPEILTSPRPPEILSGPQPDTGSSEMKFPMRDWISSTGGTARMAFIRRTEGGQVLVVNEEGTRFNVPFSRFSATDKRYIEEASQTLLQGSGQ